MAEQERKQVASWRIIVAFLIDLVASFAIFGYAIAWLTGGLTAQGFSLQGAPALLVFAAVIAYFVIFNRFLGGTLAKRLLGAVR